MHEWCGNLTEVRIRDEGDLVHDTTEEEVEFIARRVAEARLVAGGSSSGAVVRRDDDEGSVDEEVEGEEALVSDLPEEPAGVDEAGGDVEPGAEESQIHAAP